jgi:hypothetical protein
MIGRSAREKCLSPLAAALALVAASASTADMRSSDREMERFLLKAQITGIHVVMDASTYPMAVDLELKNKTRRAAFKYGRSQGSPRDDFRHEVAAYRLDRALNMHMVPVAVLRDVKTEGALIEWVPAALTEEELREQGRLQAGIRALDEQRAVMDVFDALIFNTDRRQSDQLITTTDWKLHLIDHSRAFQLSPDLPDGFLERPCLIPQSLERKLASLEAKPLKVLFGDLIDDEQIDALLARRDKILAKIAADRARDEHLARAETVPDS